MKYLLIFWLLKHFLLCILSSLKASPLILQIRRRVKQVPLAFYKATPTSLFSESDFPGWTFKHEGKETIDGNNEKEITNISDECDNSSAKRQRVESS